MRDELPLARTFCLGLGARLAFRHAVLAAARVRVVMLFRFRTARIALISIGILAAFFT